MDTFMGYPRSDGRVGIRNYVIIISLIQCSNGTVHKIANRCQVPTVTIDTGCGDFKEAEDKINMGLICAGAHPNVYGVLLVYLGCQWTDQNYIASEIRKHGKRVELLCIQEEGGIANSIKKGCAIVEEMKKEAAGQKRVETPLDKLIISLNAGGSDWTSGIAANPAIGGCCDMAAESGASNILGCIRGLPGSESAMLEAAANPKVAKKCMELISSYCADLKEATGQSVSEVNPTPGNKAGGLTTLSEKALGSYKLRGHSPITGTLECGEAPAGSGGYILNERHGGNDVYQGTSLAMSGSQIQLMSTGRGTPFGLSVCPVFKITGNPDTAKAFPEFIDYNAGTVITGEKTLKQASREIYDMMLEICNGKETMNEINEEFSYVTPPTGKF